MRMRKKKHSGERIEACAQFLVRDPLSCRDDIQQNWPEARPLFLEIGCGKGDFAAGLSAACPGNNILAVERVPDVAMFALEKAVRTADSRPDNLRFIIGHAQYLSDWFAPDTFERVYINFCDPWPQKGYYKRRLTAPGFLEAYRDILVAGGELHFKTDNEDLFDWSVERFRDAGLEFLFYTRDLHASELAPVNIETEYEHRFSSMGMPIYSAHVRFPRIKLMHAEVVTPDGITVIK